MTANGTGVEAFFYFFSYLVMRSAQAETELNVNEEPTWIAESVPGSKLVKRRCWGNLD